MATHLIENGIHCRLSNPHLELVLFTRVLVLSLLLISVLPVLPRRHGRSSSSCLASSLEVIFLHHLLLPTPASTGPPQLLLLMVELPPAGQPSDLNPGIIAVNPAALRPSLQLPVTPIPYVLHVGSLQGFSVLPTVGATSIVCGRPTRSSRLIASRSS